MPDPRTSAADPRTRPSGGRLRRIARRSLRVLLIGFAAILLLLGVLWIGLRSTTLNTHFVNRVLSRLSLPAESRLSVDGAQGDWFHRLDLQGIRWSSDSAAIATVDSLVLRYDLWQLLRGKLDVQRIGLTRAVLHGDALPRGNGQANDDGAGSSGEFEVAAILRGRFYDGPAIRVGQVELRDCAIGLSDDHEGARLTRVNLAARDFELGEAFSASLDQLDLHYAPSDSIDTEARLQLRAGLRDGVFELQDLLLGSTSSQARGRARIAVDDRDSIQIAEVELTLDPIRLEDLSRLLPGAFGDFGPAGTLHGELRLAGSRLDALDGRIDLHGDELEFASAKLDSFALRSTWQAGRCELDLGVSAYGGDAQLAGWARPMDSVPHYELRFTSNRLPRTIPGIPAWAELMQRGTALVDLRIAGDGFAEPAFDLEASVRADSSRVDLDGRLLSLQPLRWEARSLELQRVAPERWLGREGSTTLDGRLHARGTGLGDSLAIRADWSLDANQVPSAGAIHSEGNLSLSGERIRAAFRLETAGGVAVVDSLRGRLGSEPVLDELVLRLGDVDLAHWTGNESQRSRFAATVRASGNGSFADGDVVIGESSYRGRSIERAAAQARWRDEQLSFEMDAETDAGRLLVRATLHPPGTTPRLEVESVDFENVDLAAWAGMPTGTTLSGRLEAAASPADAASGARPKLEAKLELHDSRWSQTALDGGRFEARYEEGRFHSAGSLATLGSALNYELNGIEDEGGLSAETRIELPFELLAAAAGRDSLDSRGSLRLFAQAARDSTSLRRLAVRVEGAGAFERCEIDTVFALLDLADGVLAVESLEIESNVASLRASGPVVIEGNPRQPRSEFDLAMELRDTEPLRPLLGEAHLGVHEASLQARLRGSADDRRIQVESSAKSVVLGDWGVHELRLDAEGSLDGTWQASSAVATVDAQQIRSGASIYRSLRVDAAVDSTRQLGFDVDLVPDANSRLRVAGSALRDSLANTVVRFDRVLADGDSIHWALSEASELRVGHGRVEVDSFRLRAGQRQLVVHGVIDTNGEQDFHVRLENASLDGVSRRLGREDLAASLNGHVDLTGPAEDPQLDAALHVEAFVSHEARGIADVALRSVERGAVLRATFVSPLGDSLSVRGSLPLDLHFAAAQDTSGEGPRRVSLLAGNVDLRATADEFPLEALRWIVPPESIDELEGLLDLDLRMSGPSHELVSVGAVDLHGGRISLPSAGIDWTDIEVRGQLSQDRLRIMELSARSDEGTLSVGGELRIPELMHVEPDLEIVFDDFVFLDTPDRRAEASGRVEIGGRLFAPVVKGDLSLRGCDYELPESLFAGKRGASVELTPEDVRMMEDNFGPQIEKESRFAGVFDASDLELQVSLGRDNWVTKRGEPRLAAELSGEVDLRKPPNSPMELRGRIAPLSNKGYIEEFGRSFDIVDGEVQLHGPLAATDVRLRTEYKIYTGGRRREVDTTIFLDIEIHGRDISLLLSSNPAMSEEDIITAIVTGRTSSNSNAPTSEEESRAAAIAADIGLAAVSGELESIVQKRIGLDVVQVRYNSQTGTTLIAGQYVLPTVYIGFQQPLQYSKDSSTTPEDPYRTSAEVEIELRKWLVLNVQSEVSLIRSFLRARYEY